MLTLERKFGFFEKKYEQWQNSIMKSRIIPWENVQGRLIYTH